ncbi:MAG: hypothetical protein ACP5HX_09690 [Thermoproteota archaeon]
MEDATLIKVDPIEVEALGNVLINPVVYQYIILEKLERKAIYIPSFQKYYEIASETFRFPVILPEVSMLLSLDIVSKEFARDFFDKIKNFNGIISRNEVFVSNIYNFNSEENRMVSWGNIRSSKLSEETYQLYLSNMFNDLVTTPSIVAQDKIVSPNRWFNISYSRYYEFKATIHYNFIVAYIRKDDLSKKRIKNIWISSPQKLYEIKTGVIIFQPRGYLKYVPSVPLHFVTDPLGEQLDISEKGDYYLCYLTSFNDYFTSYERADIKKGSVNIVSRLDKLVFSIWDILPFLFPFEINSQELSSLLLNFQVNESIFTLFQKRLMKFGSQQNPKVIEAYEQLIEKENKTMRINKFEGTYTVKFVNPTVISFLVKKSIDPGVPGDEKIRIRNFLNDPNLLNKVEGLNAQYSIASSRKLFWHFSEARPFLGIMPFLKLRERIMKSYIALYQRFYGSTQEVS